MRMFLGTSISLRIVVNGRSSGVNIIRGHATALHTTQHITLLGLHVYIFVFLLQCLITLFVTGTEICQLGANCMNPHVHEQRS